MIPSRMGNPFAKSLSKNAENVILSYILGDCCWDGESEVVCRCMGD